MCIFFAFSSSISFTLPIWTTLKPFFSALPRSIQEYTVATGFPRFSAYCFTVIIMVRNREMFSRLPNITA